MSCNNWTGILSHQVKQSLVDMRGNQGKGRVLFKNQAIPWFDSVTSFAAVRHANGQDWWIVGQHFRLHRFFILLLTSQGVIF